MYLILSDEAAALTRSGAAYEALAPAGATTTGLWSVIAHPHDGRAALAIPETPEAAQVGLSQADYDALLSADERLLLTASLPADWSAAP